jgi:hypothetical protein
LVSSLPINAVFARAVISASERVRVSSPAEAIVGAISSRPM